MSGRKSKKNQRLGSSRRGPKGLNRNIEKDDDDGFQQSAESEEGRGEFHTTSATQFDHLPSSSIEQHTSASECPPHARGHKDSLMETELPERKRKMGSTRKSTGRFKGDKNLDDLRTTEELDEEYITQPNTSTTEKKHASLIEEQQSSFPSDVSLQTKSSGFGKESGTTLMFAVSESKEITSHSHELVSDMLIDEAVGPSVHSIAVTVAERDSLWEDSVMFNEPETLSHQETQIASTSGQKRRMDSTRRPLGGQNSENVGVREHSRKMTENERKAEVMGEAKLKMSEVMTQTWDDVARDDPSSHTESALLFSQSLLADRAEMKEPGVSAGTETMNQSVAFSLVDSEKPLPETSSHHGTPSLNEALDFEFDSHTEDLDVLNKVLKEAGSHLSDNSRHVSDTRKDTNPSYDFREEAKKEVLTKKEKPQLEELALHDQESSLSQHDIATLDNSYDCSMVQTIVGGSRNFDMPASNISHAEPTMPNLPHEMRDAVEERQEIHIEIKQKNYVCNVASVTCDTLTDLVSITKEDKDPHILAMRENENMSDKRGSETEYAFEITDQSDVRDHNVTQIIMDVRDNEKEVETSTETIWISHQKPCDVLTEKGELYKGQEHYSLNISLTHSPTQDDSGKMLENEVVRKDKKQNAAVNDVTSKSEEIFSFKDLATDRGSHAHHRLFMQSLDKEGYDLHENVNDKGEKEGILFGVESENAAFDRGNERSEGTDRIKEMDAAPVLTLDVGDAGLHIEIEAQNKTFDSTNSEADGTEENMSGAGVLIRENNVNGNTVESNMTTESDFLQSSPDAHMEALNVSDNAEKVSGETDTVLKQSDINIVPEENETLDNEDLINVENKAFRLKSEPSPDESTLQSLKDGPKEQREICEKNDVDTVEGSDSALLQSLCISDLVSEESTAISICHITESQTLTNINVESQENTGDAERVAVEEDKDLQLEIEAQNKTSDSTTGEAEETEKSIHDATVLVREVEVIGDTVTVESNMTNESDLLQSSSDAHMEALKVSENAEKEVSGETNTIPEQSDISIISADSYREETHSKSSPVIQKRKMGSTRRPLKGNTGRRKGHDENEIFNLEDEPSPEESRYAAVSICDISESQTLTKIQAGSHENIGDAEIVPAEGDTESHSEDKTFESTAFEREAEVREVLVTGDAVTVDSNMTTESDFHQTSDANMETLKISENPECEDLSDALRNSQSENQPENKLTEVTSEAEGTEDTIFEASVSVREDDFTVDKVKLDSNMTVQSDLLQSDTLNDAKLEALKLSKNTESVSGVMDSILLVQDDVSEGSRETDTLPEQSLINIIPDDSHGEEAHSVSSLTVHKRKMGSTRRPLRGNKGQRKETKHHDENETLDSDGIISAEKQAISLENETSPDESTLQSLKEGAKEQEMEICEKNDADPVEESESALLQSCTLDHVSEESTEISICHITESQTLTNIHVESKENTGDAERVAVEEDKDLQLEIEAQNKTSDSTTGEAEETEKSIHDATVLVREVEVIGDTVTVESNITNESDFLQRSPDAHTEALKVSENSEKEVSGETDTIHKQSDISIIPADSHEEEAHSKSSQIVHKRKMGSTRRPLKGNKGQRKETEHHDENETFDSEDMVNAEKQTFSLEEEPSPDKSTLQSSRDGAKEREMEICEKNDVGPVKESESALLQSLCISDLVSEESTAISICHITESQTLTNIHVESKENTGDAERVAAENDKDLQLEIEAQNKTSDSTTSEAEETEKSIHDATVLVREVEVIGDTVTVESTITNEPDLLQRSPDAHMEALKVSENAEKEVSGETNTIPEQSDIGIIPADSHEEEALSKSSQIVHKRKMGSTRRPLKGNKGQRKETEHHYEYETLDSEDIINAEKQTFRLEEEPSPDKSTLKSSRDGAKEREMEICEKDDVGPVEVSESALLQSLCISDLVSEESTAISICHITESQTLTNIHVVSQENTGDAERVAVEEDKDLQLEIEAQNKTSDSRTSEAEETEKSIHDATVLVREVEVIGDTVTVESNITNEPDLLQRSPDAHMEALKVSENAEKEVSGETNTIPEQSDISIISADSYREETHSKSSPVIQKRKMGSTRRPLKGNTGQRKGHDEKEIFNLEDEPSPEESRYAAVSICDISDSQTLTKIQAGSHENIGDAEIVPAEGDTESHSEDKTFESTAFEREAEVREALVIGDTVTVESNIINESDFLQRSPDAHMEALKVSENSEKEVSGETDTIHKHSDISIIPADSHREETHSKSSQIVHKRKMGSTRRPLKGNKGQRKETEHHYEYETLESEDMINARIICHITESQTLTNINVQPQENTGDAERVAAEDDKDLQLEIEAQNKIFDLATSEAEETEKNIQDVSVMLIREVEVIGDTVTVESNMTTGSDFIQTTPDAHVETLKISNNSEKEVSGETNTIPEQSDISIISADSHREETHSKSSPVIQKRKMGSTRRPLKGNTGRRKGHDEKEIFNLEDEPSPEESRYAAVSICDISESQTLTKIQAGSQENIGDIAPAEGDTESHSESKTIDSPAFEGEATEENSCAASALDKKAEFVGDAVESNMTIESDLIQNYTFTDSKPGAFVSDIAENEVSDKTDTISKQSILNIIPEDLHGDEEHTKLSLNVHKRKMGSTHRSLRGNKGQRKVRVESKENNEDSEGVSEEEDTETHSVIKNQDNRVDHNVAQEIMNISDVEDEERKTTKTMDMSMQELCDDLKLEQRSDSSQTQTGPSQDDTGSNLLEFPERTADFVRDSNSLSDVVMSDALLMEETQIYVSSNDFPPTDVAEMNPVSKMSMQKRKMGSTRKRGKRMVNEKEIEDEKAGATENTTTDDETTKSEDKLTPEEAITGSPVHQQLVSSSFDKEGHDIQDIACKTEVLSENLEQNDPNSITNPELLIESECSSNVAAEIPKESREDQPNLNIVVQKRKMGSTRKTLRGSKGQERIAESKKMDGNSEGMTQKQDTEPHLETSARKTELDEEVEQNFPFEFSHPVASSEVFLESENGVKEVSQNIHDLSEVSEVKGVDNTGNDSNSLSEAINLNEGTKDKFVLTVSHEDIHQIMSEPEQTKKTNKVILTQELRATQDDVVHENNSRKIPATHEKRRKIGSTRRNPRAMHGRNMADNEDVFDLAEDRETKKAEDDLKETSSNIHSEEVSSVSTTDLGSEMLDLKVENDHLHSSRPTVPETPENTLQICDNQLVNVDVTKHPQSETVSTEKRRKMGSTRKTLREGGIRGKRDGYEYTETKDTNLQMSQDSEMSLVREDVKKQTTHDYSNQSEDSLLSEIERALNKTSQSPLSCDWELIAKEPNPDDLANAPDLNMPENSEIKSLQPVPSAHSEPNSPGGRRRKMGSTRKKPREQLKAESEDEDKEDGEIDENSKANKQEKKDLERVEVSVVHHITENKLNKEYLDVSSAHTSSNQLEESTNPVSQEKTSPSTKRKFGSRRANKGKQGLGRLADSDFGNELEDGDQKPDCSEDKLHSDDLAACDPCLSLKPENQPASEQRNMEAKNEEAAPKGAGAGLVSLDQIIKHDRSTGAKQTVNLKNRISDTEVAQFNVVMVGNSCVGKTSFIRRFHEGQFTEDYHSTIGVDTCVQTVALPDRTVKLQIWDTAGQERFHSITTQVFHKADGLLLMYEITCSKSFFSVRDWISQARERAPDDVIMMLLGNKNDSVKREVQIQEGADLAREYNIHFMECSAATGANVSESMMGLAEMLVQRKSQKEKYTTLRRDPPQKKSGCC